MNKETKLIKKINNLKRNWGRSIFDDLFFPFEEESWLTNQFYSELQEDKDNYYIRAELPGIKKDKIKIELENNQLRIHAVKEEEKDVENKKYHFSEISYGSFTRNFSLPNAVNSKNIKANYEDGVLNIIIPKSVESKAQQINIE